MHRFLYIAVHLIAINMYTRYHLPSICIPGIICHQYIYQVSFAINMYTKDHLPFLLLLPTQVNSVCNYLLTSFHLHCTRNVSLTDSSSISSSSSLSSSISPSSFSDSLSLSTSSPSTTLSNAFCGKL